MKAAALFLVVAVFLPIQGLAFDEWSDEDIARHAAFTVVKGVDFLQTLKIAREPERYHERNPTIGKHPSQGRVAFFFIGGYIAETALVHVLPSEYRIDSLDLTIKPRSWTQYVFIGVQGGCVINNFSIGLGFGF